jgi:AhpD family alkylhydroperoxidase
MASVENNIKVLQEIQESFGLVPVWLKSMPPPALEGFWTIFRDLQLQETKIPNKYKELIGIAVAGATRCRYCQLFHAEAARLNGATEEEINEAAMMGGLSMMASTYLNGVGTDYEQFRAETRRIVAHVRAEQAKAGHPPPLVGPEGKVRSTTGVLGH